MLYNFLLTVHSWLRWFVLLLAGIQIGRHVIQMVIGTRTERSHKSPWERKLQIVMVSAFDFEVLIGLVLYFFVSPVADVARRQRQLWAQDPQLPFWGLVHIALLVFSAAILHIGYARVRRVRSPTKALQVQLVTELLWLACVLAAIPWPGLPYGRALFRI